jgi:glycosyltransferase involved in cell wall biosynthesis
VSEARVLFGVPGYHGEEFVTQSLDSIRAQTHENWVAWISLDGEQPAMAQAVEPYLADPRFRLTTQPARLGWVDNINWLMDRMPEVGADYWCYQQQDDVLAATYAEELLGAAERHPEAVVVYSDLVAFGSLETVIAQPSVLGSALGRRMAVMLDHHAAVAMRGLTRARVLADGARLTHNEVEDFSVDTVWLTTLARSGDLVRVPELLYRKRYHPGNEHGRWSRWPDEQRRRGWLVHCADMLEQALIGLGTAAERRLIYEASLHRLTHGRMVHLHVPPAYLTDEGLTDLRTDYFRYLRRDRRLPLGRLLETGWPELRRRACDVRP